MHFLGKYDLIPKDAETESIVIMEAQVNELIYDTGSVGAKSEVYHVIKVVQELIPICLTLEHILDKFKLVNVIEDAEHLDFVNKLGG